MLTLQSGVATEQFTKSWGERMPEQVCDLFGFSFTDLASSVFQHWNASLFVHLSLLQLIFFFMHWWNKIVKKNILFAFYLWLCDLLWAWGLALRYAMCAFFTFTSISLKHLPFSPTFSPPCASNWQNWCFSCLSHEFKDSLVYLFSENNKFKLLCYTFDVLNIFQLVDCIMKSLLYGCK